MNKLNEIRRKIVPIEALNRKEGIDFFLNSSLPFEGKTEILYTLASEVSPGGVIVEIGSYHGATAVLMALASGSSVKVHCVEKTVRPELTKYIKEHGVSGKVAIWAGKSSDVGKLWAGAIDLLFIDGDHSDAGVMNDSKLWAPYVRLGGVIVWHDYHNQSSREVAPAIDKFLKESGADFEIIMPESVEKLIRVVRKKGAA